MMPILGVELVGQLPEMIDIAEGGLEQIPSKLLSKLFACLGELHLNGLLRRIGRRYIEY